VAEVGSNLLAGRLICDVLLQAKDLLPKMGCWVPRVLGSAPMTATILERWYLVPENRG